MAKKNFRGGLDNLLSSTGIEKKEQTEELKNKEKTISDDEKYWMQIKIDRLNEELHLWRTGEITVDIFNESIEENNLTYDAVHNKIKQK